MPRRIKVLEIVAYEESWVISSVIIRDGDTLWIKARETYIATVVHMLLS
jgi:nucleoid-associated protein YgaU